MGFLAAGLKAFIGAKYPEANPNKAFDTSEIRRSLRDNFANLMKDDFNPYGDTAEEENLPRVKSKKAKKDKKNRNKNIEESKPEAEASVSENNSQEENRTYLDDFSEMLSDLEEYKSKEKRQNR